MLYEKGTNHSILRRGKTRRNHDVLEEKGVSVESEIEKAIDGIYNKSVPVGVREFISRRNGGSAPKTKKNKPVSSFAVGVSKQEDG